MSPLGPGQRRFSRSPRSQRSRSGDVDCLKKYIERRVEERRLTQFGEYNISDSLEWIPLSKNYNQFESSTRNYHRIEESDLEPGRARIDSTKWLPVLNRKVCPENIRRRSQEKIEEVRFTKQPAGRSLSSDSAFLRRDRFFQERRNTEFGYFEKPRLLQSEMPTSRYIPSPLARKYSEGNATRPMSNRWMTFTRYPSPCPIVRRNSEKKSMSNNTRSIDFDLSDRSNENMGFSISENRTDHASKEPYTDSLVLNQRLRELYDIKTETEWPKRLKHPLRENSWISKSSSEEEKYPTVSEIRDSPELEFNDKTTKFSESDDKPEAMKSTDSTFDNEWDERLRKFNERLRFSEDLNNDKKIFIRDRRTYSDDYDDMSRRQSNEEHYRKDLKRFSDASSRSRVSYAEIDFSDLSKRGSRTSDASYVSISNYSPKRNSIESKSGPRSEILFRRSFIQSERRRPSSPVPPKETDNLIQREEPFSPHSRRNNTSRYKLYLT